MKVACILCLLCFSSATLAAESEPAPRLEFYKERPLRAITLVVSLKGNPSLKSISLSSIRKIYDCTWRSWKDVPGSKRSDDILPIALGEDSDTTKLLQKLIPNFRIGKCATVINGPDPSRAVFYSIGVVMPNKMGIKEEALNAIGFMNFGPLRTGQKALAIIDDIHKKKRSAAVAATEESVKNRSYPLVQ